MATFAFAIVAIVLGILLSTGSLFVIGGLFKIAVVMSSFISHPSSVRWFVRHMPSYGISF